MYLGLDFGTSGARACVIDAQKSILWEHRLAYPDPAAQTAQDWQRVLQALLGSLPRQIAASLRSIAIDGTSGTVLLCDRQLQPFSPVLLYNDARAKGQSSQLRALAPAGHPVCTATSGLAKALWLLQHHPDASYMMHQADWLTALLSGRPGISDYHNALKSGYDVENMCWPAWIGELPVARLLPDVVAPGSDLGKITTTMAQHYGISPDCTIHAGTTDSIAAFMACACDDPHTGVTSLGTTLVLKQLSHRRIEAPEYGIYSHRYGELWLVGGASNAGAGILREYFDDERLAELSTHIATESDSPLDYYPLTQPGERFPRCDPDLEPRMTPRPEQDSAFLHGILQGLARIEAEGYARLAELGAPPIERVLSNGGGARNPAWLKIRARALGRPVSTALHAEAAYGTASLCLRNDVLATAVE